QASAALIESLSDKNSNIRYHAARALGQIRAEKAVEPLITMLQEESGSLFYAAATALGQIGSLKALDHLIESLDQPDYWDRRAVVSSLGELGSEKAVDPLLNILKEENLNVHVKREIMVAFLKIGSKKTGSALRKALSDDDAEVRLYAGEALKRLSAGKGNNNQI
ncbi:MAG: HEAT repeat domain-containing protein, partial [Candidatus Aminicenantes bacterium]|nr:HEAT repeat domain-containing protein [Candidatus Aminicenantes bacterium]